MGRVVDAKASARSAAGVELFSLGFLTLFLELALIRYLAGNIWNLGYFPNLVLIAVFVWVVVSAAFALYTGLFESYNKTWGSLSAVIVTLTWLWLTGLALLFGGEVNSEVERTRGLRQAPPPGGGPISQLGVEPEVVSE